MSDEEIQLTLLSKDYQQLSNMAYSVMAMNKETQAEYQIAKALAERIDEAILNEEPHLSFTENEVSCLGSLV